MADDVTIDNGTGTDFDVATDDDGSGNHVQIVKLAMSADGSRTPILADANGLGVSDGITQGFLDAMDDAYEVVDVAPNGSVAVMVGGRAETTTPPAVADGDVQYLWLTTEGAVVVRSVEQPRTTKYDLVTQASAVAANDQLCDEMELTSMSLAAGGGGKITNMVLASYNTTQIAAEAWLYAANPTPAGTNAVHNQTDANVAASHPIAVIDFSTWYTETDNIMATGVWRGAPLGQAPIYYDCADGTNTTSLWVVMVTRTAVTPGATTDYDLWVTAVPMV